MNFDLCAWLTYCKKLENVVEVIRQILNGTLAQMKLLSAVKKISKDLIRNILRYCSERIRTRKCPLRTALNELNMLNL